VETLITIGMLGMILRILEIRRGWYLVDMP